MRRTLKMIEILSQNVRGLGQEFKRRKLFNYMHQSSASIFFLQETHSTSSIEKQWKAEWGGSNIFFAHGESNARGVCIIFKSAINVEVHKFEKDEFGRYLILEVTIDSVKIILCNIYAPNRDDPYFFELLFEKLDYYSEDNRIIGGDFNLILDPSVDKRGGNPHKNKQAREMLNFIIEECDLVDIWRAQHPEVLQYTFRCMSPERIFTRLDFFLVSTCFANSIEKSWIAPGYLSDHSNIHVKFKTVNNVKGLGFWKFNCTLLQDREYIAMVKNVIDDTVKNNSEADPGWKWETIKLAIRSKSIQYASRKKKSKENIIAALESRLKRLENMLNIDPTQEIEKDIKEIEEELDIYIAEKTRGAMVRSRARWVEEGERSSKYFYNLEKRNFNSKTLQCIKKNETIISDNSSILNELQVFYKCLYTSRFHDEEHNCDYFDDLERPQLDEDEKAALEQPISESEVLKALKSCQNNKAPGTDGFPAEFYKVFWFDIKTFLLDSIQHSYVNGSLSYSQKQGIISLIPKKNKDMLLLKNWRPLSLLNMDYKLIAKVIANRIKTVIKKIIHSDQTGFVNGRYIGENLVKLINVIEHCEENDIPALLISIDFEKAYDFVEWSAIKYALNFFNFGSNIIKWFQILYKGVNSCVINNGHFSTFFPLHRGVRQGCPLSPYLFIIAAELLAIKIRTNNNIKGININGSDQKILQFADDTCLTILFDQDSLNSVIQTFDLFENFAGLRINYDKTDILRLGSLRNSDAKFYTQRPLNWTNDPLLILGIRVTQCAADVIEVNFPELLIKIENVTKIWNSRNLTLYGKVLISKSLLLSQLIYKLSILPKPDADFFKQVNTIISKFIWSNKPPRISKDILKLPLEKGGLKALDIEKQRLGLKIAWVKRLLNSDNNLVNFAQGVIPHIDGLIWKCNLHSKDVKKLVIKNCSIWVDILQCWCEYNYTEPNTPEEILSQMIWYNSNIRINNLPFLNKNLMDIGIVHVRDLVDNYGTFRTPENIVGNLAMAYNSTIGAVPQKWKKILQDTSLVNIYDMGTSISYKIDQIMNHKGKIPRFIYGKIIESLAIDMGRKSKWERDMHIPIDQDKWYSFFISLYSSTPYNKLRIFQYKLLQRILVTNIDRHNWGITSSNVCGFCGTEPETYVHIFIECRFTKILWTKFMTWLRRVSCLNLNISPEEIIFGISVQNNADRLVNSLLLITKQYIYSSKCMQIAPNLNQLYKRCYKQMLVEKEIAFKNNRISEFSSKWNLIEW